MNFLKQLQTSIERHHLLNPGDKVIVAVSGGPDSMALLYGLKHLRLTWGLRLHIAHFNHRLRKSADRDQKFVERQAAANHIPSTLGVNLKSSLSRHGSLEEFAREQRIAFLIQTARKQKAAVIALGHTRDDLAETVLMRILRGTGLEGLKGMLPKTELYGFPFVRPLLEVSHNDIERFLNQIRIPYCLDPTNRSLKFFRNKIRLKLLPFLEKNLNVRIKEHLAHLSETCAQDYDFLFKVANRQMKKIMLPFKNKRIIRFRLGPFQRQPLAQQRMLVRLAVEQLMGPHYSLYLNHMKEMEKLLSSCPMGTVVHLPSRLWMKKEKDTFILSRTKMSLGKSRRKFVFFPENRYNINSNSNIKTEKI